MDTALFIFQINYKNEQISTLEETYRSEEITSRIPTKEQEKRGCLNPEPLARLSSAFSVAYEEE